MKLLMALSPLCIQVILFANVFAIIPPSLNAAFTILRAAVPGPGLVLPATETVLNSDDETNLNALEDKDNTMKSLKKKQIVTSYTPDFRQLCIDKGHSFSTNYAARCVSGLDRYFTFSCVEPVFHGIVSVGDYCREGYFCVDVDGADNVNGNANTIKCVDSTSSGTLDTGGTDESETTELCNKPGDGKNKFFARLTKKGGSAGAAIMKVFVKRGGGSYGTAGETKTDGSYEISYNFDTGTEWCWHGQMVLDGQSAPITGNWAFGLIRDSIA